MGGFFFFGLGESYMFLCFMHLKTFPRLHQSRTLCIGQGMPSSGFIV